MALKTPMSCARFSRYPNSLNRRLHEDTSARSTEEGRKSKGGDMWASWELKLALKTPVR